MSGNDSTQNGASLGAQAMELALSSTQQFTDSADRLVRAIADSSLVSDSASRAAARSEAPSILAPWELAKQLQRNSLEWGLNAWVAWVGALGGLARVGRGIGLVTAEPQAPTSLPTAPAWAPARPSATAGRQGSSASRSSHAPKAIERAVAASGSKRRRPAAPSTARKRPRKKS
jgi:hypothetical protein